MMPPDSFTLANAACDRMRKNVDEMLAEVRASSERIDKVLSDAKEACKRLEKRS
jgi:hypothetical protein